MTDDEIIAKIPKAGWGLYGGKIRRPLHTQFDTEMFQCPLTAVAKIANSREFVKAGESFGLTFAQCQRFARAADGGQSPFLSGTVDLELRAKLLTHCGLKEIS